MEASSSSLAASEGLIRTLISRGWCLGDLEKVKALIVVQWALHGEACTVDSVESELANMDLREIGGKSLPDPSVLRKSSHFQGPKVLQISSTRDISRSSIADNSGNSNNQRLLRLTLTDGHSEITAIEYFHIPSISDDVIPGTKVRLENKAAVRGGIVCLNPKVITVLGGVVQSLYEEWQMNQKYSGFSRSSLRISKESDNGGPPPFEKLQIGALSRQRPQGRSSQYSGSTSKSSRPTVLAKDGSSESRLHDFDSKAGGMDNNVKSASSTERTEEKPGSSEARPKEDTAPRTPRTSPAASHMPLATFKDHATLQNPWSTCGNHNLSPPPPKSLHAVHQDLLEANGVNKLCDKLETPSAPSSVLLGTSSNEAATHIQKGLTISLQSMTDVNGMIAVANNVFMILKSLGVDFVSFYEKVKIFLGCFALKTQLADSSNLSTAEFEAQYYEKKLHFVTSSKDFALALLSLNH